MLADDHQQAALDNEATLAQMGDPQAWPRAGRMIIEGCWGAAFHWIAFGCQQKLGRHKENHARLVSYLRELGEPAVADHWDTIERARRGGWYGHSTGPQDVERARALLDEIRKWALS